VSYPAVVYPDVEVPVKDHLVDQFALLDEDISVSVGVPTNWTPTVGPHVQVSWDGTPIDLRRVVAFATVRLTAWAGSTSEAKRVAALAQGLLCSIPGDSAITSASPLTGALPARDPETGFEIASTTSRVTVRSAPIEPSGS
jgi:hypothetical protein